MKDPTEINEEIAFYSADAKKLKMNALALVDPELLREVLEESRPELLRKVLLESKRSRKSQRKALVDRYSKPQTDSPSDQETDSDTMYVKDNFPREKMQAPFRPNAQQRPLNAVHNSSYSYRQPSQYYNSHHVAYSYAQPSQNYNCLSYRQPLQYSSRHFLRFPGIINNQFAYHPYLGYAYYPIHRNTFVNRPRVTELPAMTVRSGIVPADQSVTSKSFVRPTSQ